MRLVFASFSLLVVVAAVSACTLAAEEKPEIDPAAEEAPTKEGDLGAINKAAEEFVAAVLADDPVAFAACYTEDAVLMPPDGDAITGREAIQGWYQGLVDMGGETAALEPSLDEVVLLGDWAFRRGILRFVDRSEQGTESEGVVKFIEIWQRQPDASWKIARDIWNSNLAPTAGKE